MIENVDGHFSTRTGRGLKDTLESRGIDAVGVDSTMEDSPCIHHIEVGVTHGAEAVASLQYQYRFRLVAKRITSLADQWILAKNDTRFLVTCLKSHHPNTEMVQKDEYIIDWMDTVGNAHILRKDSVFNVCLEVCDLDTWVERLQQNGVTLVKGLRTVADNFGSVKVCTIKSCVGDVYHTLVEKTNYSGEFLPGFERVQFQSHDSSPAVASTGKYFSKRETDTCAKLKTSSSNSCCSDSGKVHYTLTNDDNLTDARQENCDLKVPDPDWTTFDHVLLAVPMGTTQQVIGWYERLFGMKRFLINSEDSSDNGLVLSSNTVGLRLRAMEYWKCAEVGLRSPSVRGGKSRLFFVIAEGLPPLPGSTEINQIESWMRQHRGPGIQHIALNSLDIKATVEHLKAHGVSFAKSPPPAYYSKVGRLQDIIDAGENVDLLHKHGILIDTEADGISEDEDLKLTQDSVQERYLLQIFTQPIFKSDPFFMEIIQREGATGFGSGNVAALYRSVQSYIVGKERQEA